MKYLLVLYLVSAGPTPIGKFNDVETCRSAGKDAIETLSRYKPEWRDRYQYTCSRVPARP